MKEHGYVTLSSRSVGAVLGDLDVSTDAAWSTGHSAIHSLVQASSVIFFPRLPIGQYGPVSQLSRSEESCTGPFNWGEAHCAGEKVKRKIGPFLRKSLKNQTRTRTQQKGAQPATATRNPPARLPGARAKEENNHNKQETSQTNLGTP